MLVFGSVFYIISYIYTNAITDVYNLSVYYLQIYIYMYTGIRIYLDIHTIHVQIDFFVFVRIQRAAQVLAGLVISITFGSWYRTDKQKCHLSWNKGTVQDGPQIKNTMTLRSAMGKPCPDRFDSQIGVNESTLKVCDPLLLPLSKMLHSTTDNFWWRSWSFSSWGYLPAHFLWPVCCTGWPQFDWYRVFGPHGELLQVGSWFRLEYRWRLCVKFAKLLLSWNSWSNNAVVDLTLTNSPNMFARKKANEMLSITLLQIGSSTTILGSYQPARSYSSAPDFWPSGHCGNRHVVFFILEGVVSDSQLNDFPSKKPSSINVLIHQRPPTLQGTNVTPAKRKNHRFTSADW